MVSPQGASFSHLSLLARRQGSTLSKALVGEMGEERSALLEVKGYSMMTAMRLPVLGGCVHPMGPLFTVSTAAAVLGCIGIHCGHSSMCAWSAGDTGKREQDFFFIRKALGQYIPENWTPGIMNQPNWSSEQSASAQGPSSTLEHFC